MIIYTDPYGTTWTLGTVLNNYRNNDNLYVGLIVAEDVYDEDGDINSYKGEPYAHLSVNIRPLPENYIAVDCTYGAFDELIEENGLGTFTGEYLSSGYGRYPVYEMDIEALKANLFK